MRVNHFSYVSRLVLKNQKRLERIINAHSTATPKSRDDVYIWKGTNPGLTLLSETQWKGELENGITRCIREGDTMSTSISSYLLEIAAGIHEIAFLQF